MPLSVIGAGSGRTGTMSLKLALERLGFGPCPDEPMPKANSTDEFRRNLAAKLAENADRS